MAMHRTLRLNSTLGNRVMALPDQGNRKAVLESKGLSKISCRNPSDVGRNFNSFRQFKTLHDSIRSMSVAEWTHSLNPLFVCVVIIEEKPNLFDNCSDVGAHDLHSASIDCFRP